VDLIASFGEDQAGNLYVVDLDGELYQIVPVPEPGTVLLVAAPVLVWWGRRTLAARRVGA
jgi:hypothetical protein